MPFEFHNRLYRSFSNSVCVTWKGRTGPVEFRNMYRTHGKSVYNYILWICKNPDLSKDILQTVFIHAWTSNRALPETEDGLRKWLFTTARNAFIDSYRSQVRLSRLRDRYEKEMDNGPDEMHGGFFKEMLSECSELERSILYLHLKAGYSYAEVGVMLELTEGHARVVACRAFKRLREILRRNNNGR
jgi:RNA polymerase sigma-70 factor, ECF subfamily